MLSNLINISVIFLYVKSQAIRLGCGLCYYIAFLFPQCSGHIANGLAALFFSEKQVLTFEIADKTLRIPVL